MTLELKLNEEQAKKAQAAGAAVVGFLSEIGASQFDSELVKYAVHEHPADVQRGINIARKLNSDRD